MTKKWLFLKKEEKKRKKKDARFKLFLMLTITIIPSMILLTIIHELGHVIVALFFGWRIVDIQIGFFPFLFNMGGLILFESLQDVAIWQLIACYSAGSIHTLLWGYVFFALFYNLKLPEFFEVMCFTFSIILISEIFIYNIFDVYITQSGDWYYLFLISPLLNLVFLSLSILNIALYILFFKRIHERLNVPTLEEFFSN